MREESKMAMALSQYMTRLRFSIIPANILKESFISFSWFHKKCGILREYGLRASL
jgi:hypothetical protein